MCNSVIRWTLAALSVALALVDAGRSLFGGSDEQDGRLLGSWRLDQLVVSGQVQPAPSVPYQIGFHEDGYFGATLACNDFGGQFTATGGKIRIREVSQTFVGCGEVEAEYEAVVAVVLNARSYSITGDQLYLLDKEGNSLVLSRIATR